MTKYFCEPVTREEIKTIAKFFRRIYNPNNNVYFPVVETMDKFSMDFKMRFDIVEDNELEEKVLADTDILGGVIRIKESVYNDACNGDGLSRMTIIHEMGHYILLKVVGIKFARASKDVKYKTCMDPEWQAKCFAGEVMIDKELTKNMTVDEIKDNCGVSYPAAKYQYNINHKEE